MTGAVLILWLSLVCVGTWATTKLALHVWKQGKKVGLGVEIVTTVVVASATFCLFGTVIGLQNVFGAIIAETADPSQQARTLAEGISMAMNCTALALGLWVPSFIVAHVMLRSRRA